MARDEFDIAGGSTIKLADLIGRTVLFSPTEYVPVERDAEGNIIGGGVMTKDYGRKDVVLTDLVVIDADGGPEQHRDVMIFNGTPIGILKRRIDGKYLAVVEYGKEKVKGNYPILLNEPTEVKIQATRDYLAGRTVSQALSKPAQDPEDPFAV